MLGAENVIGITIAKKKADILVMTTNIDVDHALEAETEVLEEGIEIAIEVALRMIGEIEILEGIVTAAQSMNTGKGIGAEVRIGTEKTEKGIIVEIGSEGEIVVVVAKESREEISRLRTLAKIFFLIMDQAVEAFS